MPRLVDHELYKEEILTKCFDLFARRGYGNLTMRVLARELGISTGSLYHYFPSKEAIFEAMIVWLSGRDVERVLAMIPATAGYPERIQIILQFIAIQESEFLNLLLLVLDYKRALPEQGDRAVQEVLGIYRNAIREQFGDQADLSDFFFNSMMGLVAGRYLDGHIDFRAQAEMIGGAVLGLLAERGRMVTAPSP